MKRLLPFAALCAAACSAPPAVLPPPFSEDTSTRLFYPTGIAHTPAGDLVVANGNFDHAYDASTMVTIKGSTLAKKFADNANVDCSAFPATTVLTPTPVNPACDFQLQESDFAGVVMIGNYSGPLVIDTRAAPAGAVGVAYTGSRDSNTLNRVVVQPDGKLVCPDGSSDCRPTNVDLFAKGTIEGPYSIAPGVARIPGEAQDRQVLYVAALVPHIDSIENGTAYTSAGVAAMDAADPTTMDFGMLASTQFVANGIGVGPMIFDPVRRQLLMSGCYSRAGASAAGDPSTVKCIGTTNLLRVLDVDAAAAAGVRLYDLTGMVHSSDTSALALGDIQPDGSRSVWASMRDSDALVELNLPVDPAIAPVAKHAVSLSLTPADLLVIPRTRPAPDLVAVAASKSGTVAIYDPSLDLVVAQIERLGNVPWKLDLLPGAPAGTAWIAASVFGDCRIALIEVPLDQPWKSALRGRAGTCLQ